MKTKLGPRKPPKRVTHSRRLPEEERGPANLGPMPDSESPYDNNPGPTPRPRTEGDDDDE